MRTKAYSVRLQSLVPISAKAYKATDFNGNIDILPASQVFGQDFGVGKSDAYWISAWILEKKTITYSGKKEAWFGDNGQMLPSYKVENHKPMKRSIVTSNLHDELVK